MSGRAFLAVGAGLAVGAAALWFWGANTMMGATIRDGDIEAEVEHGEEATETEGRREELDHHDESEAIDRTWTFQQYLEELVRLGVKAMKLKVSGDLAGFEEHSRQGRELLDEMPLALGNCGELALHALTGLATGDSLAGRIRHSVCLQLVKVELLRRLHRHLGGGSRDPLDDLVSRMLTALTLGDDMATALGGLLADQPFLGATHENQILDVVEQAERDAFLQKVAVELLLTLWRNLEGRGGRSMVGLALLFRDGKNATKRLAALRHLLIAEQGRYRDLVLRQIVDRGDPKLAHELAIAIAQKLPPKAAIQALSQLRKTSGASVLNACMLLGARSDTALVKAYEEHLAAGTDAAMRADLLTGATIQPTPAGLRLAVDAVDSDPSPEVRSRALLVLCSQADPGLATEILTKAMDDPVGRKHGDWAATLVSSLANLATRCDPNDLKRLGLRLLARSDLSNDTRKQVTSLLKTGLPHAELPEAIRKLLRR